MVKYTALVSLERSIAMTRNYNILLNLLKDETYETNLDYQTLMSLDSKTKESLLETYISKRSRGKLNTKNVANVARFLKLEKPIGLAKAKISLYKTKTGQITIKNNNYNPRVNEIEIPEWGVPFMDAQVIDNIRKSQSTLSDRAESLRNRIRG